MCPYITSHYTFDVFVVMWLYKIDDRKLLIIFVGIMYNAREKYTPQSKMSQNRCALRSKECIAAKSGIDQRCPTYDPRGK